MNWRIQPRGLNRCVQMKGKAVLPRVIWPRCLPKPWRTDSYEYNIKNHYRSQHGGIANRRRTDTGDQGLVETERQFPAYRYRCRPGDCVWMAGLAEPSEAA